MIFLRINFLKTQALLQESQTHKCLPQLIGFTLHLNKFIIGQVPGISTKKDLIYLMDVISNSDLTSGTVHTEDTKKAPTKQLNKSAESVYLGTLVTDKWKWQDTSPVMSVIVQSTKSQLICKTVNTHNIYPSI